MALRKLSSLFCFLCISFVLMLSGCRKKSEIQEHRGEVYGTTYFIKYDSEESYIGEIESRLNELDSSLSTYIQTSKLHKINTNRTSEIDKHIFYMLSLSEEVYRISNGYFDPTVGPLVDAYGFGSVEVDHFPSNTEIDSMRDFIGFDKMQFTRTKLKKSDPRIQLNFNAIAKGYAVDYVGQLLREKGARNFLIEIGGEVLVESDDKLERPWTIGIEKPVDENDQIIHAKIHLKKGALATSGNYRKNTYDENSQKVLVHTIDPLSLEAKASNLLSVSVLMDDCALADAYATALMAMGKEKAQRLLAENSQIKVMLIFQTEDGFKSLLFNGFPQPDS